MLIIAKRNLSKGRMRYGQSYEVDDEEGQALIAGGHAISGETLASRAPELAQELIAIPPTDVLLTQGTSVGFEDVVGDDDATV